jgi:hypothetical protein
MEPVAVTIGPRSNNDIRSGFRHVLDVLRHRAPTKKGAPTNEEPRAKADSDKRSPRHKGFNMLDANLLKSGPP